MPPVRRRQRVRNRRRDAAFDAMRPFGFSDDLIRKHLNQLIKVYGNDGWAFIEENCYKVLTDAILDSIEQNQPEQDNQIDNRPEPDDPVDVQLNQDILILDHINQDNLILDQINQDTVNQPNQENEILKKVQSAVELVQQGQMVEVKNVPGPEVGGKELAVLQPVKEEPDVENHAACQVYLLVNLILDQINQDTVNQPNQENEILKKVQGAVELVQQGQMVEVENVPEPEVGGKELAVLQPVKEESDVENHAACQDVQRLKLDIRARGAAPYTNPKSRGVRTPKPCYGWISNDDESD